jgi:hypothetical protein
MNEKLLHFIWKHQYFNRQSLATVQGDPLEIIQPGTLNHNQGPDFSEGRVRLGDTTWAGNIELHVLASDWNRHHHDADPNYRNIILHVVWINDAQQRQGPDIPLLELQPRISKFLLLQYREMMNQVQFIPCEKQLNQIDELTLVNWKERMLVERLERKAARVINLLQQTNYHWEQTLWWMLAKNFGGKINGEAFEKLARSIPLNVLARHKSQLHQLEAILFGQAGLLDRDFSEPYPNMLRKEYKFLMKKYKLPQPLIAFQYLRMRPINFPSVKLAQLAVLIQQSSHLFSKIRDADHLVEIISMLEVTANDYWHYHYRFDEPGTYHVKKLGRDMIDNLMINTIIPLLFAFAKHVNQVPPARRALNWLLQIEAEKNALLNGWKQLGILIKDASDSQALIELKTRYCDRKRCLDCAVGNQVLGRSSHETHTPSCGW